ncbi:MarR family transcriptional regulator [Salipaludibacillus agaradhaerens]|uniref:MarR family transcriptional regulator n=1 Tax=Salipaludibacillus agaradhaerens TaxID=76935 RepID=A0A9Q4B3W6_SALAG|nr:MarR family transcriptional regulator [Salipaludibacillus agaradhaerens]MCR6097888.1 MarR family transcriptional regulator [Salipaludibacillus agaradhaerens]MCR6116483.1 MarR family transcriptional regulator [Salipaludibacillus agaradhaerens]
MNRLTQLPIKALHLEAISVVTNLYRMSQGLKHKLEKDVLAVYGLSWSSFSILYDLWIWDMLETKKLAETSGISKATVSNVTKTLERKGFCYRQVDDKNKRTTYVVITENGRQVMEKLYPSFHQSEIDLVKGLSVEEQNMMSELLRRLIKENHF